MSTTPYSFIKRGNLFIIPVGPAISEVPYPTTTLVKPSDYSLWVNGEIEEPPFKVDRGSLSPAVYRDVRDDLARYAPVEVTRSAFRRSQHAYVGVIDSRGTPYYFALDSRGISVRAARTNDDHVWKTFDALADEERALATTQRRSRAAAEITEVARELSEPRLVVKGRVPYGSKTRYGAGYARPARWWRKLPKKPRTLRDEHVEKSSAHAGTMVALYIPIEVAGQIALPGGEEASSLHITLAYLGKDLTSDQKRAAAVAVAGFTRRAAPITATLGGVGRFSASASSEGRDVVYLSVDSPGVTRLQQELVSALALEGLAPSDAHGFVPHVTLCYVPVTEPTPIQRFSPISVEFNRVSLNVGDEQTWFALEGSREVSKALPKKTGTDSAKKTPNRKATKKQLGVGGKTRYSYPNEKRGAAVPLVVAVAHDDSKHADPAELANQLGVSVRTLRYAATRLGRDGFSKFMRAHLKRFSAKHRIDPDYWGTLYVRLRGDDSSGSF